MTEEPEEPGRAPSSGGRPAGRRLRVAVLLKTNTGGMWILPQVTELRARGHEVVVILPAGAGRLTGELRRRGVTVAESPFDFRVGPHALRGLLGLRRLVRHLAPDVLHYHLLASAFAARFATFGMTLGRVHMVAGPLYLESRLIRCFERLLWRLDDVVICGCRHASNRYGQLGCPPHRRPVATYGVDTGRVRPDWAAEAAPGGVERVDWRAHAEARAKARAELGIADDTFLAVMVAYVYPPIRLANRGRGIKGHDVLLPAWRRFHARHPRTHLLIIGGGWGPAGEAYRRQLIERFGTAGVPDITWLETVDDVRPWYAAADVSVSPSLGESHGAAVEAGAMAVPSIVSEAGGLPETVDERSGWVVPVDDVPALADALHVAYEEFEAGRLAERGRAARRLMEERFDNRRSAGLVAEVIESVAAGGRHG
ncbi:glycosyltransferase family 4 protein [Micromonospora haikouensis]|uniref:glycosyltransferase family 4 protein n=1 Tax=Micromonospora haikouensis TaxID=686309 RepID=UPI003D73EB39